MKKMSFKNKMEILGCILTGVGISMVVYSENQIVIWFGCIILTVGYLLFLTYD